MNNQDILNPNAHIIHGLHTNTARRVNLDRFESINQTHAASCVSDKYKFIPTTKVLDVMAQLNWFPVAANQARTRVINKAGFQKHSIKLVNDSLNKELMVGSKIAPQILLTNSHAGTSSFVMQLAAHVFLCSNGLVRASGIQGEIRVRHMGYEDLLIENAVNQLSLNAPSMMKEIDIFQGMALSREEQLAFASSAIELKFDGDKYAVEPAQLLRTWRRDEQEPTLWNTFNVVQEKLIKGGVSQKRIDGSRIRSRRVGNIDEDIRLNKSLWSLSMKMAELKGVTVN